MGDFVVGAAGEVVGVNGNVFETTADEKKIRSEKLGELVKMNGFGVFGSC